MIKGQGPRPYLTARLWSWRESEHSTPGIGLFRGVELRAHLTPAEAYAMANRLVDLADKLQATNEQEN